MISPGSEKEVRTCSDVEMYNFKGLGIGQKVKIGNKEKIRYPFDPITLSY